MLAAESFGYLPQEIEEYWTSDDLAEFLAWRVIKQKEEEKAMKAEERKIKAKSGRISGKSHPS